LKDAQKDTRGTVSVVGVEVGVRGFGETSRESRRLFVSRSCQIFIMLKVILWSTIVLVSKVATASGERGVMFE